MTQPLILSLFPGGGLWDYAMEAEGFCVVRGPDVIWGGDIRTFHPPAGRFDGVYGGDPCQSHSSLANLVRAKGLEPSFPDMTSDFERVVNECRPAWFLRENVPKAPDVKPDGYDVRSFMLCNSTLDSGDGTGNEQMRKRRFWFGTRDCEAPDLRRWVDFALFELPDEELAGTVQGGDYAAPGQRDAIRRRQQAVAGDARRVAFELGGSGKRKSSAIPKDDPKFSRTLEEMLRLQGMPEDWLSHQPWTMQAKRKIVGNGVAVPTGRALARAILAWIEDSR